MLLLVEVWPVSARAGPSEKQPVADQVPAALLELPVGDATTIEADEDCAMRTWDTLLAATTEADDIEAGAEEVGTDTTDDDTDAATEEDETTDAAMEEDEATDATMEEDEARDAAMEEDEATDVAAAELVATTTDDDATLLGMTDAAPALRRSRRCGPPHFSYSVLPAHWDVHSYQLTGVPVAPFENELPQ